MKKIFIGIDFSKEKFDATLIKAEGLKECAPSVHEVFDNKTSGFRRLVKWVKAQSESVSVDWSLGTVLIDHGGFLTILVLWQINSCDN